jgi:hypothetical protein
MEIATTFIGILLGWLLGHASGYMDRKDRARKALRKILCELLVARDSLQWALYYTRELAQRAPIPIEERGCMIAQVILKSPLIPTGIQLRYGAALEALADYEPIAAYQLHSKASVGDFLIAMQNIYSEAKTPHLLEYAIKQSERLEKDIVSKLDCYILEIAGKIDKRAHRYIKENLLGEMELGSEASMQINFTINSLMELAKYQEHTAVQTEPDIGS